MMFGDLDPADLTDDQRDAIADYLHGDSIVSLDPWDSSDTPADFSIRVELETGRVLKIDERGNEEVVRTAA